MRVLEQPTDITPQPWAAYHWRCMGCLALIKFNINDREPDSIVAADPAPAGSLLIGRCPFCEVSRRFTREGTGTT